MAYGPMCGMFGIEIGLEEDLEGCLALEIDFGWDSASRRLVHRKDVGEGFTQGVGTGADCVGRLEQEISPEANCVRSLAREARPGTDCVGCLARRPVKRPLV